MMMMLRRKDYMSLDLRLRMPIDAFAPLGDTIYDSQGGQLTYIDRGAEVLAVAHLDHVMWLPPRLSRRRRTVYCPQLDDRLGVWVVMDLLPRLGVVCDLLLTDNEEIGRSTAELFVPPKQYNWMFQFDRHGTDVVMYDYESDDCIELLAEYGFRPGIGTYSDICMLSHLGVVGFNFGVGYHHEHTRQCYARLSDTLSQAELFAGFYHNHCDTRYDAPELVYDYDYDYYSSGDRIRREVWECSCGECNWMTDYACIDCGAQFGLIYGIEQRLELEYVGLYVYHGGRHYVWDDELDAYVPETLIWPDDGRAAGYEA